MGETNCGAAVALTQDASFWFNSRPVGFGLFVLAGDGGLSNGEVLVPLN
jgi:hypothetical protein